MNALVRIIIILIFISEASDSKEYGETEFVNSIIAHLKQINPMVVELQTLSDVEKIILSEYSSGRILVPIMYGNSFALETTHISYPSIVVTGCSATSIVNSTAYLPNSIDEYRNLYLVTNYCIFKGRWLLPNLPFYLI